MPEVNIDFTDLTLYKGECRALTFDRCGACFALKNPTDSGMDLYVRATIVSNGGCYAVAAKYNYYGRLRGELRKSKRIISSNVHDEYPDNKAMLLSADEARIQGGTEAATVYVPSHQTYRTQEKNTLLIAPGNTLIVQVVPVDYTHKGCASVGFEWWEKKVQTEGNVEPEPQPDVPGGEEIIEE